MRDYNYRKNWNDLLTPEIVKKLTLIHEYKGEQRLFIEAHKDELKELVEIAKVQSTEASNKIEGISTADDRLKNLVQAKTTPRNRDESEIAGYRDVLNTIHENYDYIPINANYILQLHRDLYKFLGNIDGGIFKTSDNIIREMDAEGNEKIRFRPVAAWETPASIDELCKAYNEAKGEADSLLLTMMFILDFLCIHPFNDGNGRMSRLLTLLLLYQSGFIVGKYISIEKIIEGSKETYYEVLQDSSINWHENENDYKEKFYIFDFCGNFEFFRMNKGKATANMMALQGAIFNLKFEISYKLQDIEYQIDRLVAYRKALVMQMSEKVRELPRDNFAVRQHLKYVDLYSSEENYNALTYEDTLIVKEEVAPLILSDGDEASAVRFDALMYGIELAYLAGKKYSRARSDLHKKIAGIASVANIPEIQAQTDLINKVLNTDYVDTAGINEFEEIREKLRNLMKYLPNSSIRYDTNFTDEVLSTEWNESELENDDLKNYKAKAEYYIRQHQDNIAIAKLKRNKPLTSTDIAMLEEVLWSEVGTKQDYEQEFGEKPLGEFVREIVGLDMNAAKEAFSEYLTNASLDSRQIYFVNQIVEYIVHNGMMKDLSVLQESPFTDRGSVVEIFTDLSVWMGIRKVIDMINANAVA